MTFDEILKDPKYQAEFDAKIAKALETAKGKWDEEAKKAAEEKQKELEENAKLSAEEKIKKDMEKLMKENEGLKADAAKRLMKDSSLEYIKSKGYSNAIIDLVDLSSFTDEKDMQERLDAINTNLSNTISKELDNKLKENGYPDLASKAEGVSKDSFNFDFAKIKE
jgi:hypothetical protein